MEKLGWIANFAVARDGRTPRDRQGRGFTDANVYNLLEALNWETDRRPDAGLDRMRSNVTSTVASAQEPDGYINTFYGHQESAVRYTDLEWGHELFCYGHLFQAGGAELATGRNGELAGVARRAADHVCETFGPDGNPGLCGHPEIELALVALARSTQEQRYLDQAALFIDRRGRGLLKKIDFGQQYFQDDVPVREALVLRGHAVRALYLAAGALDVGVETGDDELVQAVADQYDRTLARRTYITGGMGSRHEDESFGADFELPPDSAYCETCAGIASVMVAWRLLLATGEASYADIVERTLFNLVAASPSASGTRFFYSNTLHQREPGSPGDTDEASSRSAGGWRAPWYDVACCPTNLTRTLPTLSTYFATWNDSGIQIHQYATCSIATNRPEIELDIATDYPFGSDVRVRVIKSPAAAWTLAMRIPGWCQGATFTLDEKVQPAPPGYLRLTRTWRVGDELVISLPLTPRWVKPDHRIDAVRGTVALERGPVTYCIESLDQPGPLERLSVDSTQPIRDRTDIEGLEDVPGLVVGGFAEVASSDRWPYGQDAIDRENRQEAVPITFIPYHAWANRSPSTMRVWVPTRSMT
jgi:DUF1680 family protein